MKKPQLNRILLNIPLLSHEKKKAAIIPYYL